MKKIGISEPLKSRFLRQILINAVISKYWDFNRIFMDLAQKSGFQRYLKSQFLPLMSAHGEIPEKAREIQRKAPNPKKCAKSQF